ncbi:MAG: TIM44-like domain-containing protein [Kofleriaceae bacterium]|nr:TIM44-like domain-containing protein [Kofleriaceae bacterium]
MRSIRRGVGMVRFWTILRYIVIACTLLMLVPSNSDARPGGGGGYSGGSSGGSYSGGGGGGYSSGGGYDGGGGEMSPEMFVIFLVLGLIVWGISAMMEAGGSIEFDSSSMVGPSLERTRLSAIRQQDENFSEVVFGDWMYALVSRAYSSPKEELKSLAPYLSASVRGHLSALSSQGEVQVVIGSITDTRVWLPDSSSVDSNNYYVAVTIELNLVTSTGTTYLKENWSLHRKGGVLTHKPEGTQVFNCPNCHAVFQSVDDEICGHCQTVVGFGVYDWFVVRASTISKQSRSGGVGHYSVEVGTRWHTTFDPYVRQWIENLQAETGFDRTAFTTRCAMIFHRMNEAWSEDKLESIRGLVSDGIYSYLDHGLQPYREANLRNVIKGATVSGYEIAKVTRDAYYDAVVIRIWASGLDYVVQKDSNEFYSGNQSSPREYSEYWTMIRGRGVKGKIGVEPACPNCGAELSISMSGNCDFCQAHVTSGEFDWVLGKIEQDESYIG